MRRRRFLPLVSLFSAVMFLCMVPAASAQATSVTPSLTLSAKACAPAVLVLSAYPAEIETVLAAATLDPGQPETVDGREFFLGQVEGKRVIMALTGMGTVNAHNTTTLAFSLFRCGGHSIIHDVVFSGTAGAGAGSAIGDVTVPQQWTPDFGQTWEHVNPLMLFMAAVAANTLPGPLSNVAPLGDPLCLCEQTAHASTVHINRTPKVIIGGSGQTSDSYAGRAFPCVPDGGNLFGCQPCDTGLAGLSTVKASLADIVPLASLAVVEANVATTPPESGYVANDEETASAMAVAAANDTPFIAFRGISDDNSSDYFAQFAVYQQLAADNAGAVELSFLRDLPPL
jgi:nucleoside phosphorylase